MGMANVLIAPNICTPGQYLACQNTKKHINKTLKNELNRMFLYCSCKHQQTRPAHSLTICNSN